jgi:hypothetical protein
VSRLGAKLAAERASSSAADEPVLSGTAVALAEALKHQPEPTVGAVALVRRGLGHELIELVLPESVIVAYAVKRHVPEMRGIVAARVLEWAEKQP